MLHKCILWLVLPSLLALAGCTTGPSRQMGSPSPAQATRPGGDPSPAEQGGGPLAYINGEAVTRGWMFQPLLEAAGGRVLNEIVLNRMVRERLDQQGIELTKKQIEAEKQLVLRSLAGDKNQSVVLLQQMRRRAGLGGTRFRALLKRNAGLRRLVQDQVKVTDGALRRAYQRQYGPRYEGRILVTARSRQARRRRDKITDGGAAFATVAARHSTDPSAAQGGLLSPISPADPSYPKIVRRTLSSLKPGQVSEVIAVEDGYAILKLVRKIEGRSVKWADVKEELTTTVRRRAERLKMRSLARSLISEANVVVLNRTLGEQWRQHKQSVLQNNQ